MISNLRKQLSFYIFLLIAFAGMLFLQLFDTLTLSDDLLYHFVWQSDISSPTRFINDIDDIIESQSNHYFLLNGRLVVHCLAQAFLSFFPPVIYQVINAILFSWMLYLCSILMMEKEKRFFGAISAVFFLFVVFADFKTPILWSLGTFNYLWVSTFTLAFLVYLRRIKGSDSMIHWLISPLSLLIGCSHEAISLPLSITFIIYTLFNYRKERFYPRGLYILWFLVGTAICLLSPGIWNRAGGNITLFNRLLSGVVNIVFNLKVTWVLFITLVILYYKDRPYLKQSLSRWRYFYVCLFMTLGIVFFCGTNLIRVVFFTEFISMLLVIQILSEKFSGKWQKGIVIGFTVLILAYYIPAIKVRYDNYGDYLYIENQIMEEKKDIISVRCPIEGEQPVMDFFRRRFVNPAIEFGFYCIYMAFNTNDNNTRLAAQYYGKQQIIFLPEDVIDRIDNDTTAYRNYELDHQGKLYIWQLNEKKPVEKIIFHLQKEDISKLNPIQRFFAYQGDTFEYENHFHYSVIELHERSYLVFTRPVTNIFRRIKSISYL